MGTLRVGSNHNRALTHGGVQQSGVRTNNGTGGDARVSTELNTREYLHIAGQLDAEVNEEAGRVMDGHTGELVAAHNHLIQESLDFAQLNTVVDPLE
ncbi:unannotated protein [freshwater metagenome]|uniref:Unannotated protein n=1 Tax=freshwater metagenome TaxID=449393 RepID=A0A6J6JKD3_9ZZZZ